MHTAADRLSRWRTPLLIGAIALIAQLHAPAQTAARELLNSERIAAAFGNYGIEVLEQDETVRVSNLFSRTGDEKTCRTFAIVRYMSPGDPALAGAHAAVVAGGSIGAVFAAQGWEVRKTHLSYGERAASAKLAALMRVPVGTPLAEHAYLLDVIKGGHSSEYAALVEIHHPDYLDRADLAAIYGRADGAPRAELLTVLQASAAERVR
jgi:hypothetical protein